MRVDWCVSSWFRIKNTHSLTHLVLVLDEDILWPVQVGTLSFSHPSFGVPVLFIYILLLALLVHAIALLGCS